MLNQGIIEFVFRGMPEAFIHIFAIYAFIGLKVDKRKYLLSSIILAISMVMVRRLPISYGIHTILIIMIIIGLTVLINQLSPIYAIKVSIINVIIQFLAEGTNIFIIDKIFRMNMEEVFSSPINKIIYGLPSLVIWACVIGIAYKVIRNRQRAQNA